MVRFAGVLALVGGLLACKESGGRRSPALAQVSAADAQLIARRDALLKRRTTLKEEQARLVVERQKVVDTGGDTSELDRKVEELRSKEVEISTQESDMLEQILDQNKLLLAASAGDDATAHVAARESSMAGREKSVATREERMAEREALVAEREQALARREKETCGVAAPTTTIIQTVPAKGSSYSKGDVEPALKRARSVMSDRGILLGDLPGSVRELEREATTAMAEADYGRAYLAASQLLKTVSALPIDRAFIKAKSLRISAAVRGKKLAAGIQKQVDDLFADATAKFVDEDYKVANKKLNAIWSLVR